MAQVRIDSTLYVRSHGKAPKGFGAWGFLVMDDSCGKEVAAIHTPAMTLTDAKKYAKAQVAERFSEEAATGFLSLEVAP